VFAGYGWGEADHTSLDPGNDIDLTGWKLGAALGANFTVSDGVVVGIVGDIAWSDISGTEDFGVFGDITHTIDWQGSLRARLGFDGGAFMPYLTGGAAFAHATREVVGSAWGDGEGSATHFGWTAGAGVEIAATEDLSVDVAYRYSDFGEQEYDYDNPAFTDPTIALTEHLFTVGLNWRF